MKMLQLQSADQFDSFSDGWSLTAERAGEEKNVRLPFNHQLQLQFHYNKINTFIDS